MKKKICEYLFLLIISQIFFFIIPIILFSKSIIMASALINVFLSFAIIKHVEKLYYKKYNTFYSMLYMSCPLIGIVLVFGSLSIILKLHSINFLFRYYLMVYICVYIIDFFYVIFKMIFGSK